MGGVEFLVSQYADDTSLILDGSRESLENCIRILKLYADASGFCVNIEKTKVIWIGSRKGSKLKFCEHVNLQWEMNEFTVLGVKFTYNLKDMVDLNYAEKLNEIKKLFLNWSKRILTPLGKITVIKSLALSKINHLILALPNPSKKKIDELQIMFYQYLWDKKPDKIKRTVITQNYTEGGLRMIDVGTFMNSLKLTWLRRILRNRNKYNDFIHIEFPFIIEGLQYGSKYFDNEKINTKNKFWKDVMLSLNAFLDKVKPNSWKEILSIPLWYNASIKVGGNVVFYRSWKNKGILMINDLLDADGELLTYVEFQRKYQLLTNFLVYEGIVKSIKDYIFSFRFAQFLYRQDNPILTYSLLHILRYKKGCRDIYDKLNNTEILPISVRKWQLEFNITQSQWKNIFALPFKVTQEMNLRWLQIRINHRILGLNNYLYKMKIVESDKCTFCNQVSETIQHLFWECEQVEYFWNGFETILHDNCGLLDVKFNAENIIFGNQKYDNLLNELILIGKRYIFHMKKEKKMPTLNAFLYLVKSNFKAQKYNAVKNQTLPALEKRWDKYRGLLMMVP